MDAESFTELAMRVIAGEASADDRRALETELSSVPARRDEFEQLRVLRATAPMTDSVQATTPELPAYRVNELRTAVRQHFGPASQPVARAKLQVWPHVLRWVFGGGGLAAAIFAVVVFTYADQTVEVGLYGSSLARGGDQSLTAQDIPTAKLLTFEQDAPFDQWQNAPLAWNEHAKIWIDNERDLIHVVRRVRHGQIVMETQPLAPTDAAQRDQIKQLVESLQK